MIKYKTYEAITLQQAILKMTLDLGKDALLVSHRNIKKGGIFGLFGKKMVELTAALPIKPSSPTTSQTSFPASILLKPSGQPPVIPSVHPDTHHPSSVHSLPQRTTSVIPSTKDTEPSMVYQHPKLTPFNKEQRKDTDIAGMIQKELHEIKLKMENIIGDSSKHSPASKYPGKSGELYIRLLHNEVEDELAEQLIKRVIGESPGGLLEDESFMEKRLEIHIANMVKISGHIQLTDGIPKIILLIGPTGIGKTTTLAKLAAEFAFNKKKRVAILTVDTYRIAAVDQLKAYCDILGLSLDIVFSPKEFKESIEKHRDADLILIDTAGRSQRNSIQMAELKSFIDMAGYQMEIFLLLSTTTKDKELVDIVNNFKRVSFHKFIFTKIDETVSFGHILNLLTKTPQGVAYVTTGQNVPEDIEEANSNKLAKLILGNYSFKN